MASSKRVKPLSPADSAYIAGVIDGEGTVTLCRKHRNENHQVAVSISNTDYDLLKYVLDTVGAGKITRKRIQKSHHTPSYVYAVYNRQALQLLAQIVPYLKTYKAQRTRLLLDHYLVLTPRNGKYSKDLQTRRDVFVQQILAITHRV
ncbi:MAG TPA: hypothetical protein ENK05_12985 [Gammaproteobacteria bacterium]|nr:hypothetical protein [Gammaproteobacteria bacterium]